MGVDRQRLAGDIARGHTGQGASPSARLRDLPPDSAQMRLADRGLLKSGLWADIVIFDPERIRDLATFENPNRLSEGMQYVLVNGTPVIDGGKMTGARPGKVLRGPGYRR